MGKSPVQDFSNSINLEFDLLTLLQQKKKQKHSHTAELLNDSDSLNEWRKVMQQLKNQSDILH